MTLQIGKLMFPFVIGMSLLMNGCIAGTKMNPPATEKAEKTDQDAIVYIGQSTVESAENRETPPSESTESLEKEEPGASEEPGERTEQTKQEKDTKTGKNRAVIRIRKNLDTVVVRSKPSLEGSPVVRFKGGTALEKIQRKGDWTKIRVKDSSGKVIEGWISNTVLDSGPSRKISKSKSSRSTAPIKQSKIKEPLLLSPI